MSDKPYDDAKTKWLHIAVYALAFGLLSIFVRYALPLIF